MKLCLLILFLSGSVFAANPKFLISSTKGEKVERVRVTATCTTATCTIADKSAGVNTVTRSAQGIYSVNFVSGTFSAVPTCVINAQAPGVTQSFIDQGDEYGNHTTTAVTWRSINAGNTATVDAAFSIICQGPG